MIETGEHVVRAVCPRCREVQEIEVDLAAVLKVTEGEGSQLGVRSKAKAASHACGQTRFDMRDEAADTAQILRSRVGIAGGVVDQATGEVFA